MEHADLFLGRTVLAERIVADVRGEGSAANGAPWAEGRAGRFVTITGGSGSGKSSLARAGVLAQLRGAGAAIPGRRSGMATAIVRLGDSPLASLADALAKSDGVPLAAPYADFVEEMRLRPTALQERACTWAKGADSSWRLIVLIDQFEDLFKRRSSAAARDGAPDSRRGPVTSLAAEDAAFIDNLLHAAEARDGPVTVIVTIRTDFLDRCAAHRRLGAAVTRNQHLVGPILAEDLPAVIERPAQRSGITVDPRLTDALVREMDDASDALPLLQLALTRLWVLAPATGELRHDAYKMLRGLGGIVDCHAETAWATLRSDSERDAAKEILLRLVDESGDGRAATRRRVDRSELATVGDDPEGVDAVLERLSDADRRLVTIGAGAAGSELAGDRMSVELVHDRPIGGWRRLREWIDTDRVGQQVRRALTEAAAEWDRSKDSEGRRDDERLFRGRKLREARDWVDANRRSVNQLEEQFVQASEALREREAQARAAQQARELDAAKELAKEQHKAALRLRRGVLVASVLAVLALMGLVGSLWFLKSARASLARAESEGRTSNAHRLVGLSREAGEAKPQRRLLLAVEATLATDHDKEGWLPQAQQALVDAVRDAPGGLPLMGLSASLRAVAWSSDGRRVATASGDGTARVWDLGASNPSAAPVVLKGHEDTVTAIAWSSDGRVATASEDGTARVWTLDAARLIRAAWLSIRRNLTEAEWAAAMPGVPYRLTFPNRFAPEAGITRSP